MHESINDQIVLLAMELYPEMFNWDMNEVEYNAPLDWRDYF
ncbi:hypothetical protein N9137_02135 [Pseudomonadales bacterium]|nr:hypothetical protein [Pseudomonadales bacterium]